MFSSNSFKTKKNDAIIENRCYLENKSLGLDMTPFGAKLRQMRQDKGVTLKQMAKDVGVSSAYLSALEHGRRGTPTWSMVQRIISYFNVIWDEAEELQYLAEISDPRIVVDTAGMNPKATEFANKLAKYIDQIDPDVLDDMLMMLIKNSVVPKATGFHHTASTSER